MARRIDYESAGNGAFLLGALAGALVGAGMALLLAPKTGAQVRSDISSGLNTARDAAARRYRELADKAGEKLGYENKSTPGDRYNSGTASISDAYTAGPGTSGYQS
jgi:gas vesicle protein